VQSCGSVTLPLMAKPKDQTPHVVMVDREESTKFMPPIGNLPSFERQYLSAATERASSSHPAIVWKCFFL
jgi:hypothetical protein